MTVCWWSLHIPFGSLSTCNMLRSWRTKEDMDLVSGLMCNLSYCMAIWPSIICRWDLALWPLVVALWSLWWWWIFTDIMSFRIESLGSWHPSVLLPRQREPEASNHQKPVRLSHVPCDSKFMTRFILVLRTRIRSWLHCHKLGGCRIVVMVHNRENNQEKLPHNAKIVSCCCFFMPFCQLCPSHPS